MTLHPAQNQAPNQAAAIELLRGLLAIPSLSRNEAEAVSWLVRQMAELGYERVYVDEVGNAIGEIGAATAPHTVVLLGHIDTVPGDIPVRIEESSTGPRLYGRGSVDAKGPLATFTVAVAQLGAAWAHQHNVRLVVAGAVEEEAATSKGARYLAARFNGSGEPIPSACIIGEPSGWQRVTLGYKGRLLVEMEASQAMAHTAGPDQGVATLAVDFWNWLSGYAGRFNEERAKSFEQLMPSLRELRTWTDEEMQDHVWAKSGIRLPLDFDVQAFGSALAAWGRQLCGDGGPDVASPDIIQGESATMRFAGAQTQISLCLHGYEPAWRSDRNNALVRAFLAGIRDGNDAQPSFVVKTGTSDMNVVGPLWRCPIVAYGPGDSTLDHTPHEHIMLDDYIRAIRTLNATLHHLAHALPTS